ncbi:MAG: dihydrodipicolinate synthase family protein, partial [Planctomycetota bacterium]
MQRNGMPDQTPGLPNGFLAASLTPLTGDLKIDQAALVKHCRWLLDHGCDGVAPFGTTGEANSFTVAERLEAVEALAASSLPAHCLIVGTGCCAFPDTVRLTRSVVNCGMSGALLLPPFYYKKVSEQGLYEFFDRVIQEVAEPALKIYLYHFPAMTGV